MLVPCALCVHREEAPADVWCGLSDDRCTGFSAVRWLFGSSMIGLLVVLFVPLFLSLLAMPGLCCFLRVAPNAVHGFGLLWCSCQAQRADLPGSKHRPARSSLSGFVL